ncbi:HpaA family protein [Helicobacter cynogastricus]|uniref:HpaA family protein n=1 Tax=Helicobacter cynogastricus TaxID=329937 RepID=UPI000CF0E4B2|nr:HpaA family protein [Helicobacter cynogastricus]
MKKTMKGLLLATGVSLAIAACATDTGANSANKAKGPADKQMASSVPLNFDYPIDIAQETSNGHTIGILAPHIQVSENLQSYAQQFQEALVKQIQDIFQKRGYQVVRFTEAQALTPEQKHKIWAVLDMRGWMGILEDIKMNTNAPEESNTDTMVDQSSGSVWFKFFEPETGRVIHNFAVEVGTEKAITHTYTYKATNSGGFAGSGATSHTELDKNRGDAIHKILNKMYIVVMKKLVSELTDTNINRYRKAIEKIKSK